MQRTCAILGLAWAVCSTGCGDDAEQGSAPTPAPERDAAVDAGDPPDRDTGPDEPYRGQYDDDAKWICRPGLPDNPCEAELRVTELLADGTTEVTEMASTPRDVGVDCFYVYPTVDPGLFEPPRNRDFPDIEISAVQDTMAAQALPFRALCNIYSPVYRQASLGSFAEGEQTREDGLEYGYADIADAFEYFLHDADPERPFVLLAHSQGSMVTLRLIRRRIQDDPRLRERLVVAVLAGPLGGFNVPKGELVGGTLADIPLCASARETGCALTFNSFSQSVPPGPSYTEIGGPVPPGYDTGCTNHPAYSGDVARLGGALFPSRSLSSGETIALQYGAVDADVEGDYVRIGDLFTAQCKASGTGLSYLEIALDPRAGDLRQSPVKLDAPGPAGDSIGLHSYDYAFIASELFDAVETKIDAHASP